MTASVIGDLPIGAIICHNDSRENKLCHIVRKTRAVVWLQVISREVKRTLTGVKYCGPMLTNGFVVEFQIPANCVVVLEEAYWLLEV